MQEQEPSPVLSLKGSGEGRAVIGPTSFPDTRSDPWRWIDSIALRSWAEKPRAPEVLKINLEMDKKCKKLKKLCILCPCDCQR